MAGLAVALRDLRKGNLNAALAGLESQNRDGPRREQNLRSTALAEVLHLLGKPSDAKYHAETVLHNTAAEAALRSRCLTVLGSLSTELGDLEIAAARHRQAVELARKAGDPAQLARTQLRLLSAVADKHDVDELAALATDVRKNVMRAGDPQLLAYYHIVTGRIDAKRGLLDRAGKHLQVASSLLKEDPNCVLDAIAHLDASTTLALMSHYEKAVERSKLALEAAVAAGAARAHAAAVANLGQLLLFVGRFAEARPLLEQALRLSRDNPELKAASLDSLAQLSLSEGRIDEAESLVEQALNAVATRADSVPSWYYLSTLGTKVSILKRRRLWSEVLSLSREATGMADARSDCLSGIYFRAWAVEAAAVLGNQRLAEGLHTSATSSCEDFSLASLIQLGRAQSVVLSRGGDSTAASYVTLRTWRLADALGDARAKLEITDTARVVFGEEYLSMHLGGHSSLARRDGEVRDETPSQSSTDSAPVTPGSVEAIAHLLSLTAKPLALGREIVCTLAGLGCTSAWSLKVRGPNGVERVLCEHKGSTGNAGGAALVIVLGSELDAAYEISAVPRDTFLARTTLLAIKRLVENAVALETLRRQEKERASLWPVEVDVDGQSGLFASPVMREVVALAHRIAQSGAPVLITGETGVGKEVIAREIHARSAYASGRFVPYNCTAVPRDMMDSQLFGHRRGAFTGAIEHAPGLIRGAQGGTVFLDEIGELSLESQPKLLRFLESSEIQPIGEPQPVRVNVRVIAATNADLAQLVRDGRFREDLYYRLDILRLSIPPLRERREEIPAFCAYFLDRYCRESRKGYLEVSDEALEYLVLYDWPGNVRQLAAEMRRIAALAAPGVRVSPADLSPEILASRRTVDASRPPVDPDDVVVSLDQPLPLAVEALERAAIERAMRQCRGRVERAAEALGISRKGLFLKRKRLGLPVGDR